MLAWKKKLEGVGTEEKIGWHRKGKKTEKRIAYSNQV
jgi:hypothetical protein